MSRNVRFTSVVCFKFVAVKNLYFFFSLSKLYLDLNGYIKEVVLDNGKQNYTYGCSKIGWPGGDGNPDARRLYDDLISRYNKLVRPVMNVTDPLTVHIKLKLSQLIEVKHLNYGLWILRHKQDYDLEELSESKHLK
ncbi:nicotinic acetylcholine receptor alpha subunit [Trichonephila clavata]|uniref:Nicotinic acetylcholine receptor alpha subunit n=1 Tax=Trichonephila clavata TaxID=2740835 RepID=A0A8X6J565_TRICU|nr:nicotinic acetylcholine receptor alpha subunit [Trichonephila clavata]